MCEVSKVILAVISGVTIFVAGQFVLKFMIEPLQTLKKTISEIQHALIFHAPAIQTPVGDLESERAARDAIRKLSCDLRVNIVSLPLYRLWVVLFWNQPSKKNGLLAATHLIGLSNSVYSEDRTNNHKIVSKICSLINLEPPE